MLRPLTQTELPLADVSEAGVCSSWASQAPLIAAVPPGTDADAASGSAGPNRSLNECFDFLGGFLLGSRLHRMQDCW